MRVEAAVDGALEDCKTRGGVSATGAGQWWCEAQEESGGWVEEVLQSSSESVSSKSELFKVKATGRTGPVEPGARRPASQRRGSVFHEGSYSSGGGRSSKALVESESAGLRASSGSRRWGSISTRAQGGGGAA